VGYTKPFDQSAFSASEASRWSHDLRKAGLLCHAISAHIDLGLDDAVKLFRPRMDFARAIGARTINTNACRRDREHRFLSNIAQLARHGEAIGLQIGLENPGDGEDNVINLGADGEAVLAHIASPVVGLNFDSANLASHRPEVDITVNTLQALASCIHYHVKDVTRDADGWRFVPVGAGDIDQSTILGALGAYPDLAVSIELPLRLRRGPDAQPIRTAERLPLADIEAAVKASLDFVVTRLS
jgi:sugar phosphate isomerase/epimerase